MPKLKNNLLSLTALTLAGWRSVFEDGSCTVTHGDFTIQTPIEDGLCIFESNPHAFAAVALGHTKHRMTAMVRDWHERLGHVSKGAIVKISDKVEGLDIDPMDSDTEDECQCEACAIMKQHRLPFEAVERRSDKPLQIVHSDLCGPFPVKSLSGGVYYITFTDDYTRYCRVYILRDKEAKTILRVFQEYKAWAEKQSGCEIKAIRTDGGTEYRKEMEWALMLAGIEPQKTAPHTPQSNGVSERMNRTLMDMVGPMLEGSNAPTMLWGEAVVAACYIKNRLPTRSLKDGRTPFELWTGWKSYVGHIRKFGCTMYRHIPKANRKKLDPK